MMKIARINILLFISVAMIFGSLFSIFANREIFPFSPYPMYAEPIAEIRVVKIVGSDSAKNHFLLPVLAAFSPFFERSLAQSIAALHKNHNVPIAESMAALELSYQKISAQRKLRPAQNIYWVQYQIPWPTELERFPKKAFHVGEYFTPSKIIGARVKQ